MQTLILKRESTSAAGTVGMLYRGRIPVCYTLELPWRDNAPGLSCIPAGGYLVEHLPRSASGKYHDVYHVTDVPGRSGVLIHPGNFGGARDLGMRTDILGCILPGRRLGMLPVIGGRQLAVLDSRGALKDLHLITNREPFHLEIIGDLPCFKASSPRSSDLVPAS